MSFGQAQEMGKPVAIKDEGVTLTASVGSIDFTGGGVTGSTIGSAVTEAIPGTSGAQTVSLIINPSGTTTNLYISTTGNDANDGLTALTPKLTFDGISGVFSLIPILGSSIYQINIADGTYTLSGEFIPTTFFSTTGNSDNKTVIKLVGNIAALANVIINAPNTTTNMFLLRGRNTLFDFDGIQFGTCATALNVDTGFCFIRNCNFVGYSGTAVRADHGGQVQFINTPTGGSFTPVLDSFGIALLAINKSVIQIDRAITTVTAYRGTGFLVNGGGLIQMTSNANTLNFTGNLANGGLFALNMGSTLGKDSTIFIRGTINITRNNGVIATAYAINAGAGMFGIVAGAVFNFTDCTNAVFIGSNTFYQEGNTCTWNYLGTTPNSVSFQFGSAIDTANIFGGATVIYTSGFFNNSQYGYDGRYASRGTSVVAANDITLGVGSTFNITGNTQINRISNSKQWDGKRITLRFSGTPLMKHNQVAGGGFYPMQLAWSTDFQASAGAQLMFEYNVGTLSFEEVSRTSFV